MILSDKHEEVRYEGKMEQIRNAGHLSFCCHYTFGSAADINSSDFDICSRQSPPHLSFLIFSLFSASDRYCNPCSFS